MDVDANGVCNSSDVLTSSVTGVDLYLDTNHNAAGTVVTCSDGTNPLDIASWDVIIHSEGDGSVSFDSFTPSTQITNAGFVSLDPFTVAGPDVGFGYHAQTYHAAGPLKLGTLNVTVTGTPDLIFLGISPDPGIQAFGTGFGSHCSGTTYPNTITLGVDFTDNCGTAAGTPTTPTTWGKIKQLYH
jgi:hypothetical protein